MTLIVVERHEINGLPFLEVVKQEFKDQILPTVFFYHGWTNCKEVVLVNGYEVAQRNMRAIIPDAMLHGERSDGRPLVTHFQSFPKIVTSSTDEFGVIVDYLVDKNLTDKDQIGVTGLSMGGMTTCAIMACYDYVKAADCLMGAPNFHDFVSKPVQAALELTGLPSVFSGLLEGLKPYDLSLQPEKIDGRPFHFWHGINDEVVPYEPTKAFYDEQKEMDYGKNLTFTSTEDGHKVPYMITIEMADFFARVL